jgi:hypothetical protein
LAVLRAGVVDFDAVDFGAAVAVPWLRATLGVLKLGCATGAACAAGAAAAGAADATGAGAGAATLKLAAAKPPVGRDAVRV